VDWWLRADPAARVETEGGPLPTQRRSSVMGHREDTPDGKTIILMKRCAALLRELIRHMKEHPGALNQTSHTGYRTLMMAVGEFGRLQGDGGTL
jgi:hypothetical protein